MATTLKALLAKKHLRPEHKKLLRQAVAKDVLRALRAEEFTPVKGAYLTIELGKTVPVRGSDQISEVVKRPGVNCTGCALGALLFSYVGLFNDLTLARAGAADFGTIPRSTLTCDPARDVLNRFFSMRELGKIEAAFEEWDDPTGRRAYRQDGSVPRLKRIMSKIARDGSFLRP